MREGDIVSLDAGLIYKGLSFRRSPDSTVSERYRRRPNSSLRVTRESFFAGMKCARAGGHLHDISAAIDDCARGPTVTVWSETWSDMESEPHLHEDAGDPEFPEVQPGNPTECRE